MCICYMAVKKENELALHQAEMQMMKWMCGAVVGWLRGSVVERRSSNGVLSLSCARPVADG